MGALGVANTATKRLAWAFLCLVGHEISTRGGKRCPAVLAAYLQQLEDQPDAVDMETGSAPNDYDWGQ